MTFKIVIDTDLQELATEYLENRRKQLPALEASLKAQDFQKVATIAHNMKGVAASYGFEDLGRIGNLMEQEADAKRADKVRSLLDELTTYLANVQIEFKDTEAA